MLENSPCEEYAMSFFDGPLVPGAESSKAWLDLVVKREGSVSEDWYVGEDGLRTFVADFQFVNDSIQDQSKERRIVSYVVLVTSTLEAARTWLCPRFVKALPKVYRNTTPELSFLYRVIIPSTVVKPNLTHHGILLCVANVELFKMLERISPAHIPCGFGALDVMGPDMTTEEKFRVLTTVKCSLTRKSIKKALETAEPKATSTPLPDPAVQDTSVVDVVIDGRKVTERRVHDSYINVTMILRRANSIVSKYLRIPDNADFVNGWRSGTDGKELLEISANKERGTSWAHPKVAVHIAQWCGETAVADLLSDFEDDTLPVARAVDEWDTLAIEAINVGPISTTRRSTDNYVQVVDLCKSFGSSWHNFAQACKVKNAIADISKTTGIAFPDIVVRSTGYHGGVWAHSSVAVIAVDMLLPKHKRAFADAINSPFRASTEFVKVRNSNGDVVTLKRLPDGFHDTNVIAANSSAKTAFKLYANLREGQDIIAKVRDDYGDGVVDVTWGVYGGTFVHERIARAYANFCGVTDLDAIFEVRLDKQEDKDRPEMAAHLTIEAAPSLSSELGQNGADANNEVVDARSSSAPTDTIVNAFEITEADDGYMLNGMKIRRTGGMPQMISVYDFITAVTEQHPNHAGRSLLSISSNHPEVTPMLVDFKFPGRGQRFTPVTDARGLVMIMNLLPGQQAAQFRLKAADVIVRYLGGDQTLISEIQRNAAAQDVLPDDNIGRLFGEAVSASGTIAPLEKGVVSVSHLTTREIKSITGAVVPPARPGFYLAICSQPDESRFKFPPISDDRVPVAFGWSGSNTRSRVEDQQKETGDYQYLDGFDTVHGFALEREIKRFAKHAGFSRIHGTYTWVNGKQQTKTEFLLLNQVEYNIVYSRLQDKLEELECSHAATVEEKTKQRVIDAAVEMAKEATQQAQEMTKQREIERDIEIEREKTKRSQADSEAAREKMLFEASPQMYMQYIATRYGLAP
jgi:KilA-N domain